MTDKEKTQAYDEALELARKLNKETWLSQELKDILKRAFPELAENEDERIRKALVEYFKHVRYNGLDLKTTNVDEVLSWLEKQKPVSIEYGHINDGLHPLIDEEIDLWIKENENIHHNDKNIVGCMRVMAYQVASLTKNFYKQKPFKWTEEDEWCKNNIESILHYDRLLTYGPKMELVDWLNSLKERIGG